MKGLVAQEAKRKIVHLSGILVVLASYYLNKSQLLYILITAFFIAAAHAILYKSLANIPLLGRLFSFLHSLSRKEERAAKIYFGAVSFFFSLALLLYFTQSLQIFRAAALVLIFADSASAVVGKAYGKTKLPWNRRKSLEGSIAGFAASLIAVAFVLPLELAFLAAFTGMLVESINWKLNDNLTIPLAVGFLLWLLL